MAGRFSVEAVFKAVDRVTAPVSRMQNRVGKFTRSANRNFKKLNRTVDKFSSGLKKGAVAVTGAALIMTAAFTNVVAAGAGFEQAITNVGAVSLKTRAEIAPLEQMAIQLGKTTKFTATEAANAMEILSRAGFNTQQVLEATPAILGAAAASGLELAETADHVSNALKGMELGMDQAGMVSDVLTLASSKTNSTIGSLGESLRNVAATARDFKIPFKDVVAGVALLQDVGLDASVAGSAFNTMLTKMAAPTTGMQKKMRRLGITFKDDLTGNMLPLPKVLEQIDKASKRLGGNMNKVAFLAELVGLRGQKAASNLGMLFKTGKFTKLSKELDDFNGKAKQMAELRMNTFSGSMLLLGSAIDAVKVKIFGMNEGPLKDVVDRMTAWVSTHEDLIATKIGGFLTLIIDNLQNIAKWAKRIGIALAVFTSMVIVLKTLALIIAVVNGLMLLGFTGLIIIGVMALIAAITAVVFWWDELKAAFMSLSGPAKVIAAIVAGPIGLLIAAGALIVKAWEPVKAFFISIGDIITRNFDKIAAVGNAIKKFSGFNAAQSIASTVADFIGGDDQEDSGPGAGSSPQVVSPQERVARSIEEKRTTNNSEITLRTDAGTSAEVTGGNLGAGLKLQQTGAF